MQPEEQKTNQPSSSPLAPGPDPTPTPTPTSSGAPTPPKNRTGLIVGIIVGAVILVSILITVIVLLNRPSSTQNANQQENGARAPSESQAPEHFTSAKAVAAAYVKAYETKDFSAVLNETNTCKEYIDAYGINSSVLETNLEPFTVTGEVNDEHVVTDVLSEVDITISLQEPGKEPTTKPAFIKAVKEDGYWKFCGEGSGE